MNCINKAKRGSSIMILLILVFIACLTMLSVIAYVYSMHRLDERSQALERASMTAEAGLHQIIHYFVKPADIPANVGNKVLISNYMDDMNPAPLQGAGIVFVDASQSLNANLISLNNAKVTRLEIMAPRANATSGTVFTFVSTAAANVFGQDPNQKQVMRTATMDVSFAVGTRISLPAAIITASSVGGNGQFNMHWGEAWSKQDVVLLGNKSNYNGLDPFGWNISADNNQVKSETTAGGKELVKYISAAGHINDKFNAPFISNMTVNDVGVHQGSATDYRGILYQNQDAANIAAGKPTLSSQIDGIINSFSATGDPSTGYDYWKATAIRRGTYFRVAASGAVYDGTNRQLYISGNTLNSYGTGSALTKDTAIAYYRTLQDAYVCFLDTKNGQPPVQDGSKSNWANISYTGAIDTRSKGVLYVAGDLNLQGSGTPPSVPCIKPDDTPNDLTDNPSQNLTVWHEGAIFTEGSYASSGNGVVYGSIVCKGPYNCGGNPNVYYNCAMANGDPQPLSTRARVLGSMIQ